MRRTLTLFMLCLLVLTLAAGAAAQTIELRQTVLLVPDDYVISIPDGWQIGYKKAFGKTELSGGGYQIDVYTEEGVLSRLMAIDEYTTSKEILLNLYDDFVDNAEVNGNDVRPYNFNGKSASLYNRDDASFAAVMQLEDATFVFAYAQKTSGEALSRDEFNDMRLILGSVTLRSVVMPERENFAIMGEPCIINPPEGVDVRLRVGPGIDRAAIAYLPPGNYNVQGQAEDRDGAAWFKLDRDQAAPNKSAKEIWVEAEDVEQTGDCDLVAYASPPLLIPIPRQDGLLDIGVQLDELHGMTPPAGAIVPTEGTYSLIYGKQGAASCLGGASESFTVRQRFGELESLNSALFVKKDGSAFIFSGIGFTLQPDGAYVGQIAFGRGTVEFLRLFPVNGGRLSGYRIQNFRLENTDCSISVEVVLTQ